MSALLNEGKEETENSSHALMDTIRISCKKGNRNRPQKMDLRGVQWAGEILTDLDLSGYDFSNDDLFNRVQFIIKRNRNSNGNGGGRTGNISNLFAHLAVCSKCNGPMAYVNKSSGWEYLQCDRGRRGIAKHKSSVPYKKIETMILFACQRLNPAEILL